MRDVGDARNDAAARHEELSHIAERFPWINQVLKHIGHEDVVKPLPDVVFIHTLHIHREHVGIRPRNLSRFFIQLHAVEFCRRAARADLHERCPARTSDF